MLKILTVEDSPRMAGLLKKGLTEEGYMVEIASDGQTGLESAQSGEFDLILLDINLPLLNGFELIRSLRASRSDVPVIMITARDRVEDRIAGLDGGADDYIVKPFEFDELLARMRAVMRRPGSRDVPPMSFEHVSIDSAKGKAWCDDELLPLAPKEFDLLRAFLQHPRQTLSRKQLEEAAWGSEYDGNSNRLDVYVNYLRNKLESNGRARIIQTIRGQGYRLDTSVPFED